MFETMRGWIDLQLRAEMNQMRGKLGGNGHLTKRCLPEAIRKQSDIRPKTLMIWPKDNHLSRQPDLSKQVTGYRP